MALNLTDIYGRTSGARKVLVVDLGFLGDSVHLVPALWELKRGYPEAALHVMTTPLGAEVLRLAPCVDRAWGVELQAGKRTLRQQWAVVRTLRREGFEVAFNFSGADRTLFMTALTGAKWRVAHAGAGRWHFWNRWLIPHWVSRRPRHLPIFEQRRQVLAACGLALEPARFDLRLPEAARAWAAEQIPAGALHFSLNASTPLKEWPVEHWTALAQKLRSERGDVQIVCTGSNHPRERSRLEAFAAGLGAGALVFTGLPIERLAAALARCVLHVGADSGVLHLAMALGLPTVSVFREYPGLEEWAPAGPPHRRLTVPCPCADQKHPPCESRGIAECLAGLKPEAVANAVREQLARTATRVADGVGSGEG
jgi:ADP-heptose:LPS heptosyltransferase